MDEWNEMREKIAACEEEIGKGIIGQNEIVRQILLAILSDGNVLLEGVPGVGKTQMVKTFAKVLGLEFSRIQFTPDLMPADVTGTNLIVKEKDRNVFQFETGPVFANLLLADEINRATPKTQAALLEAMQEKSVTVGKTTYPLPSPFFVLATQNPIENEGTYPLPEAQLDRFLFKLYVKFPSTKELKEIMNLTVLGKTQEIQKCLDKDELAQIRAVIRGIPMAEPVQDFALALVSGTHPETEEATPTAQQYITCGASPRAAQAIFWGAKAMAFLDGRTNVSFDDVKYVAYPALRHRIIPNFDALSDGVDTDEIITRIIAETK